MTLEELEQIAIGARRENAKYDYEVNVCMDLACASQGAGALKDALVKAVEGSGKTVLVRRTGCMGPCSHGPLVRVDPDETLYSRVKPADAERIAKSLGGPPAAELQCDLAEYFDKQVRVVLENAGYIDPEKIDDYISRDGYKALLTVLLEMTPNGVVHRITESGLRGRGGGGYPTGLKWGTVAKASGDVKYVVCNGDEGDPGAFMDRSVMEGDPHRVIEGMAIAAYAVGASKGYIYVRAEYPIAVARLNTALREARRNGLLGMGIGNTPFNFDVEIRLGAGAFVCGGGRPRATAAMRHWAQAGDVAVCVAGRLARARVRRTRDLFSVPRPHAQERGDPPAKYREAGAAASRGFRRGHHRRVRPCRAPSVPRSRVQGAR